MSFKNMKGLQFTRYTRKKIVLVKPVKKKILGETVLNLLIQ